MSDRRDFIVVGGGIAGLATALGLAKHGYRVSVYDQGRLEDSATSRATGILTFQMPPPFMDWAVETWRIYKGMLESEGGLWEAGALLFSKEKNCIDRIKRWFGSRNLDAYYVDVREAEIVAGVKINMGEGEYAMYTSEILVDVGQLLNTYHRLLSEYDVDVKYGADVKLISDGVKVDGVSVKGEVIIAAGPWTPQLIPELKDKLIIYKCQVAHVKGVRLNVIIEDDILDYYASPAGGNTIMLGDGSNARLNDPREGFKPDMWESVKLMEKLAKRIEGLDNIYPISVWSAPCVVGIDGFPVAGVVREGLYVIAGFNGVGISLAPAVAERVVGLIRGVWKRFDMLDPHRDIKEVDIDLPEPYRFC